MSFLLVLFVVTLIGCSSHPWNTPASVNSYPVQHGDATTNEVQAVAYLQSAHNINERFAVTPYNAMLDQVLGALIALSSAAAGWFGSHRSHRKNS